jgi:hypothetical protein
MSSKARITTTSPGRRSVMLRPPADHNGDDKGHGNRRMRPRGQPDECGQNRLGRRRNEKTPGKAAEGAKGVHSVSSCIYASILDTGKASVFLWGASGRIADIRCERKTSTTNCESGSLSSVFLAIASASRQNASGAV